MFFLLVSCQTQIWVLLFERHRQLAVCHVKFCFCFAEHVRKIFVEPRDPFENLLLKMELVEVKTTAEKVLLLFFLLWPRGGILNVVLCISREEVSLPGSRSRREPFYSKSLRWYRASFAGTQLTGIWPVSTVCGRWKRPSVTCVAWPVTLPLTCPIRNVARCRNSWNVTRVVPIVVRCIAVRLA